MHVALSDPRPSIAREQAMEYVSKRLGDLMASKSRLEDQS